MSKPRKKKVTKRKAQQTITTAPPVAPPVTPPPITPEVQELMTQLVEKCTSLVYDLVECDCENRKECQVFNTARGIARVLRGLTKVVPRRIPRGSQRTDIA